LLEKLKSLIREQDFNPGFLGLFVNPFYFARKGLHQEIIRYASSARGSLLDVGCGSMPYRKYFNVSYYVGLDLQGRRASATHYYDGKVFPFGDGEFNYVLTSQVLEHVFNPDDFLSEIHRVLRKDGILLLSTPFLWDEHEQPFDYARYSSFGLRYLLERHDFEVLEHQKTMDDIRAIFQIINAYIYKKTITSNVRLNLLLTLILMAPFNILGVILGKILPRNNDLYLDNVVLAQRRQQ
jgi:SAM-dependent methyltransferase